MNRIGETRPSMRRFLGVVLFASAISLGFAVLFVHLLDFLGEGADGVELSGEYLQAVFAAGILGPLFETAIMAVMISFFFRLFERVVPVVIATALCWGLLHGLVDVYWGVGAFFGFVVFATVYLRFIGFGFWWAFAAAFLNHGIHNSVVVTLAYM